jgi:S1-C subfamily serine protease
MRRLSVIVIGAVLIGGLGGAALALALGSSSDPATSSGDSASIEGSPLAAAGRRLSPEAIYKLAAPGVVVISATQTEKVPATFFNPATSEKLQIGGSGFVVDPRGDIVTNDHVVQGATDVRVGFSGGATYPATIVGADPSTDLAVIRVRAPASALRPLALADSGHVEVGDPVYAIGNPFGLDRTMTAGIVSATGRDISAPNGLGIPNAIQTDAPINHGNSGGPLLDAEGRVIGINDQIESGGTDGNVGVGFSIASNTAKAVVPVLIARGHVTHAWLGVEVAPIDPSVAAFMKGVPDHGVLVVRVVAGSPAAKAGLVVGNRLVTVNGESMLAGGDAIVAVDGKQIDTPAQLADVVRTRKPGDRLSFRVVREDHQRTVTIRLGDVPS